MRQDLLRLDFLETGQAVCGDAFLTAEARTKHPARILLAMKFVELPRGVLDGDDHGSRHVTMLQLARLDATEDLRVHIAWCGPDSVVGRHPAGAHQLFAVVSGSGWVADSAGQPIPIAEGQAVVWNPGEVHESGSEVGMIVAIVASATPIVD
ncbi:AraC family ligand binding domain-containing protein [Mycolicibacterium sp. P9-22]|uniref:AraC family ligand binding domain-containing protein n=1 Tax=Mycolicibacterium sp. P9-22 TaxID=2024613 RepID=UPI001D13F499|nr:AraC family ligand binding domain-containing protein [Mycolicibacterium sp. P9-22]